MPIFYQSQLNGYTLNIWKIEEDPEFFIEAMPWKSQQLDWLNNIHPVKRIEYLASRYLIYQVTGKFDSHLYKDEAGKLFLKDQHTHLSISHSGEWVGLTICDKKVGFDLQIENHKIHTVSRRFLSIEEYEKINKTGNEKYLIQCWCIKEAVYKAYGKKGILFSNDIQLELNDFKNDNKIQQASLNDHGKVFIFRIQHDWKENFGWAVAVQE